MRDLELVGLTRDGRQLIFVDTAGTEFAAPADDKLRAALRGDRARLGQLEIEMDSVLRPRDIQARIRSGATPEEVASVAQVSVDRILPYCVPVLAERQHVAELARRSHIRRKNADGPARRLVDIVAERLRGREIDPGTVSWDAWRREDGKWAVQAAYASGEQQRSGLFVFDVGGRYSVADDDEARWLTGERQATRKGPQPRPAGRGSERRLAAVPTGDDLLSVGDAVDDESTDDLTAVVRAISDTDDRPAVRVDPDGYPRPDVGPDSAATEAGSVPDSPEDEAANADGDVQSDPEQTAQHDPEPVTEATPDRKRRPSRRASVPSWDEIMLGGGPSGGDDATPP